MKRFTLAALCAVTVMCPLFISAGKASAGEVLSRELNQQQRIYQGVDHQAIQPQEFRNLEGREDALNAARQRDLSKDDGHLTAKAYYHLNQREDQISRSIDHDIHD